MLCLDSRDLHGPTGKAILLLYLWGIFCAAVVVVAAAVAAIDTGTPTAANRPAPLVVHTSRNHSHR